MKSYVPLVRAALVAGALAIAGATASVAHDPNQDVARLQRELDELRAEKNQLQDQNLDLARRFDTEKRRLQIQLETAQKQLARLEAGGAAPARPASPLDLKTLTVNFDSTPLTDAAAFLQDIMEVRFDVQGVDGLTVRLRGRNLTLRAAIDLLVANTQDASGAWADLVWSEGDDGVISIRPR